MDRFEDLFGEPEPVSVSEYTREVKRLLESEIRPVWVRGEVSNLRRQASGHLYFSLKDAGAQLPTVMFRLDAGRTSFALADGMEVLAFGQISVYEPAGRYQLIARELSESGQGRLHREFERLKRKLADEGLFDAARKRPIPQSPIRLGIVTSPTGAALQDFIRILKRRGWPGRLTVIPAKVQGVGAADEIVEALSFANEYGAFDAIVLARGGGSLEDLWCFNEERVARAVGESRIPTISAVGHEIDFTLCDFAADLRAETPSAAAELITSSCLACLERLAQCKRRLFETASSRWRASASDTRALRLRLLAASPQAQVERAYLRLDELEARLAGSARERLSGLRERWRRALDGLADRRLPERVSAEASRAKQLETRLERAAARPLESAAGRLRALRAKLDALSPKAVLRRGFALLQSVDGKPLGSASEVARQRRVKATMRDGEVWLDPSRGDGDALGSD